MSYTPPPEDPSSGSWPPADTPPAAPPPGSPPAGFPPAPGSYAQPAAPGYPPPAAPGYPPPSYGAPAYGSPSGYGGTMDHPQGTTILVLGILSLVVCGILGPFAWSMGNKAIREIDASPGLYNNRGQVQAGRICGMIASVLLALGVIVVILAIIVGAASSSSSSY